MRIVKDVIRENIPQFRKKEKRKNRCRFPKNQQTKKPYSVAENYSC